MDKIELEKKYILEYIFDSVTKFKTVEKEVENADYHHNASYDNTVKIIKYGILSLERSNKLGLRKDSEKRLKIMSDITSHANGSDGISLSKVGLTDLYKDELEYDPFDSKRVDILVSNDLKTNRYSEHYGNEFIAYDEISRDKLRSIDIRLLRYAKEILEGRIVFQTYDEAILSITQKYNHLRDISLALKQTSLKIPFREMSDEKFIELDTNNIIKSPKIIIKG